MFPGFLGVLWLVFGLPSFIAGAVAMWLYLRWRDRLKP